ncbi:C4-dicarboxylate ABC transporter substrate-binding protein [Thioclava dalianensis]|uniref:C4-dicarboxylate ABC transporter substrate-binding protein n=1 Tax=Thioclava dalianensis TaxID=1185766 RepID=A0A074TEA1_9RHOB|nr:TRAP transporter substrate-binding protein [Thioclava dalianensis]KEP70019.1 C4-dicarboxylate ABC transporter substrate-binding protein [Thioclava dalianensis]SFN53463.1 TRAP-type C4-dicarboxylate transport system, substrate-binding protein [Thioclava dalianensis]
MKHTSLSIATVIALGATLSSASAQELKYANWAPPTHTINAAQIEPLAKALSEGTDGAVTLRGYHGGELGAGPADQYVRVLQGTADMGWGVQGYTSSQFPKTLIAELPGALPLDAPGYKALWQGFDQIKGEYPQTEVIALWGSEPNILMMHDKEVRTPADLKGLKIRVAGSISAAAMEALGATPVQIPMTQVYNGLQTGLIDGVVSGASILSDFKLNEVVGSVTTGPNLGRLTFYTVMNKPAYDGLPPKAKAALDAVKGEKISKMTEEAWIATAAAALDAARASDSTTVIDLDAAGAQPFNDALADVTDTYVSKVGGAATLAAMRGE